MRSVVIKLIKRYKKKSPLFFTNVGISGAKQHLYFATICENQKLHSGGGINDEQIELYFLNKDDMDSFIFDETKSKNSWINF